MEILIFWLVTSITSVCIEVTNELRVFKDIANAGYKVDIKKLSKLKKQLNLNYSKTTILSMLVPIFNIAKVLKRKTQYNNARPMLLEQLDSIDSLEKMSEIEKKEYLRRPTGLNALLTPIKMERRLANAASVQVCSKDENSEIFYEIGKSFYDITILKATGDASQLTVEEQKQIVLDAWENMVSAGLEKYGNKETFKNAINNNTSLDLSYSLTDEENVTNPNQELSISEQIQKLEELKNELSEEQTTQTQYEQTLTKQRK